MVVGADETQTTLYVMRQWLSLLVLVCVAGVFLVGCRHSQEAYSPGKSVDMGSVNPVDISALRRSADYRLWTYDFLQRLEASGRAEELRKWGRAVLAREGQTRRLGGSDVPEWLSGLDPASGVPLAVVVMLDQAEGKSELRIYWGGGFGMWGITVSQADRICGDERTYLMRWERGLYVFHLLDP